MAMNFMPSAPFPPPGMPFMPFFMPPPPSMMMMPPGYPASTPYNSASPMLINGDCLGDGMNPMIVTVGPPLPPTMTSLTATTTTTSSSAAARRKKRATRKLFEVDGTTGLIKGSGKPCEHYADWKDERSSRASVKFDDGTILESRRILEMRCRRCKTKWRALPSSEEFGSKRIRIEKNTMDFLNDDNDEHKEENDEDGDDVGEASGGSAEESGGEEPGPGTATGFEGENPMAMASAVGTAEPSCHEQTDGQTSTSASIQAGTEEEATIIMPNPFFTTPPPSWRTDDGGGFVDPAIQHAMPMVGDGSSINMIGAVTEPDSDMAVTTNEVSKSQWPFNRPKEEYEKLNGVLVRYLQSKGGVCLMSDIINRETHQIRPSVMPDEPKAGDFLRWVRKKVMAVIVESVDGAKRLRLRSPISGQRCSPAASLTAASFQTPQPWRSANNSSEVNQWFAERAQNSTKSIPSPSATSDSFSMTPGLTPSPIPTSTTAAAVSSNNQSTTEEQIKKTPPLFPIAPKIPEESPPKVKRSSGPVGNGGFFSAFAESAAKDFVDVDVLRPWGSPPPTTTAETSVAQSTSSRDSSAAATTLLPLMMPLEVTPETVLMPRHDGDDVAVNGLRQFNGASALADGGLFGTIGDTQKNSLGANLLGFWQTPPESSHAEGGGEDANGSAAVAALAQFASPNCVSSAMTVGDSMKTPDAKKEEKFSSEISNSDDLDVHKLLLQFPPKQQIDRLPDDALDVLLRGLTELVAVVRTVQADRRLCIICEKNPRTVRFEPCNHTITCEACADRKRCPQCRVEIEKRSVVMVAATMGHDETEGGK